MIPQLTDTLTATPPAADTAIVEIFGKAQPMTAATEVLGGAQPMAAAEEVFGPLSSLAAPPTPSVQTDFTPIVTDNAVFSAAVLGCFIWACMLIYIYRDHVAGIFNILRGNLVTEKMLGEQSKVFNSFLGWSAALGLLAAALACLRAADIGAGAQIAAAVPRPLMPLLIPAAWTVTTLIWGFQYIALKVAGNLTLSHPFTDKLFYFKKITLALGTLATLPVFLCFALTTGGATHSLGYILGGAIAACAIFLIIRTFMLFVRQNFSILLWILYLCAVEIFPVSLVIVSLGKMLR